MSKKFIALIVVQLVIIVLLGVKIVFDKTNVLGVVKFNPLNRKQLLFHPPSSDLKYFFEFQPDSTPHEFNTPWLNREITYNINSDTLHEKKNYKVEKEIDTFRIMTLGDSFTFGMYVMTDENWSKILEKRLNSALSCNNYKRFEVINLGVSGYDIHYSLERFKLRGQKYDPDAVLWLLKDDDFDQLNEAMRQYESDYIEQMKETGEYQKSVEEGDPYRYMKYVFADMEDYRDEIGQSGLFDIQDEYILEFMDLYKKDLVFLTFANASADYREYMKRLSIDHEPVHYLEIADISSEKGLTFLPYDFHPTQAGHQVIAEYVFQYVAEHGIIPCQ